MVFGNVEADAWHVGKSIRRHRAYIAQISVISGVTIRCAKLCVAPHATDLIQIIYLCEHASGLGRV